MVGDIFANLGVINRTGTTILLVEQNVHRPLQLSHRGYVMENGRIALHDTREALRRHPHIKRAYLAL